MPNLYDDHRQPLIRRPAFALGLGALLAICAGAALAQGQALQAASPDWVQLLLGLAGGLALFLAGLQVLSEGMKKAAGEAMTVILARLTTNRFTGALTGTFVTGVLNSSTVTTLLVVGFVSGGMMTLAQSVGVIMGANIGSTVTAQLLAFNLSEYSLGPVAIGFFMFFSAKREKVKYYGMMVMGLGLVFYGMGLMGEAMKPLRSFEPFLEILRGLERPAAGILAGAVFTAVVQSSAATVGLAIAMASEGLLALPAGIALALGANIGTAVTTALMGIMSSKSTEAVRTSVVHVAFNVIGVALWLPLIGVLADIAISISPSSPGLEGHARAAAEVPRQIANANTFFNVANTVIFIGFSTWFARLAEWMIKDHGPTEGVIAEPEFLDDAVLAAPSVALRAVRLELGRVGGIALEMLRSVGAALKESDASHAADVERRDDEIDVLETEILRYLGKLREGGLTENEGVEFQDLMVATDNLESLGDVIESDLAPLARRAADLTASPSDETREMLTTLFTTVTEAVELTVRAIRDEDERAAASVLLLKSSIGEQSAAVLARKASRLSADDPSYITLVQLEMGFVDQMRRIYTLSKRIAKTVLPDVIAERE